MDSQIPTNGCEALTQFLPVASVASVAKRAEPLETVGLADDGARPYHLASLAPGVASSTHVIQPTKGRRQLVGLRQRSLAGCLPRAIDASNILKFSQKLGNMFYERGTLSQLLGEGGAEEPYHRCGTRLLFDKWGMRCDP